MFSGGDSEIRVLYMMYLEMKTDASHLWVLDVTSSLTPFFPPSWFPNITRRGLLHIAMTVIYISVFTCMYFIPF